MGEGRLGFGARWGLVCLEAVDEYEPCMGYELEKSLEVEAGEISVASWQRKLDFCS